MLTTLVCAIWQPGANGTFYVNMGTDFLPGNFTNLCRDPLCEEKVSWPQSA